MEIIEKTLKNIDIKFSGRSSDYIFPTIIQGCFGRCSYCYAARHNPDKFYNQIKISQNIDQIIEKVKNYDTSGIVKPNQTHAKFITWDIACNADIVSALHLFDWEHLFDYFKYSDRDFGTFATKFVNDKLLKYNPDKKIRVRTTLVPLQVHNNVEKNTADLVKRINFLNKLYDAGYEVHVNFSPVIYYTGWLDDYMKLFKAIDFTLSDDVKKQLQCEVIFLTHNENLHNYNVVNKLPGEHVLWVPELQENKVSKFGGNNVRYNHNIKRNFINEFSMVLGAQLPYCNIRYIF
jgi:spore photoproduct lyase